eukprot:6212404-Pleurochrysis_carterae.AAC.2
MRAAKPAVRKEPRSTSLMHTHVALDARTRTFVSRHINALGFVVSLCVARCVHTPVHPGSALAAHPLSSLRARVPAPDAHPLVIAPAANATVPRTAPPVPQLTSASHGPMSHDATASALPFPLLTLLHASRAAAAPPHLSAPTLRIVASSSVEVSASAPSVL